GEGFKQAHINCDAALSYDNFVLNLKSPITKDKNDIRADVESIKGILDKSEITAIVATEQYVAELCSTAVSEMGKAFPENYELICFDYEGDSLAESKYTYVLQNEEEMGIAAIRQLISQIDDQSAAMRTVIKSRLIFGNSTK
ncbi:MAG: substrate-binding domain-containing protein, partial [Eubacterium sp.]|nr:substrate-binding domain-containing protein [Eubacterium sp.]